MKGTLKIKLVGAVFDQDHDLIGKMDCYVIAEVGSQKFKTKVADGAGQKPTWNEEFTFKIDGEKQIHLAVWDDDVGRDDFIGETFLGLEPYNNGIPVEATFGLTSKGKSVGHIKVQIDFDSIYKGQTYNPNQPHVIQPGPWGQ